MIAVIDTSALLRLFVPDGPVPDGLEEFFRGVEKGNNAALAPELLLAEVGNALNKKVIVGLLTLEERSDLLSDILDMPLRYARHRDLMHLSLELAREYVLSVYDCLFLALALEKGGVLFTADGKLLNAARKLAVSA